MNEKLLKQLVGVVNAAQSGNIELFERRELTGFSSRRLMHCLQGFSRLLCGKAVYVELGVFQGLTLITNALANPEVECIGIDNFSLFNSSQENLAIVNDRIRQFGANNAKLVNLDYEEAFYHLDRYIGDRKVGVLFIDGPHDYRSQLLPLLLSRPYLAEDCAIFIDDSNYPHVRQANCDFLRSNPDFALLLEAYTPAHIANLEPERKDEVTQGWWNGVNVIVRDPVNLLPRHFPPENAKHLYVQSHETFRHEFAELAFPALEAAQELLDGSDLAGKEACRRLRKAMIDHRRRHPDRYRNQNTYSAGLSSFVLHL